MRVLFQLRSLAALLVALPAGFIAVALEAQPKINTGTDEQAGLPYWEVTAPGIEMRLVQRLPDQTRAFFQGRGFRPQHTEVVAQNCVFQTIFKNTSDRGKPSPLRYDLKQWIVHVNDQTRSMKTREFWREYWRSREIPVPQQLAFNWALLPTEQSYQPGDYNWGMSIFGLEPGRRFDLTVVWHQHGQRRQVRIEDMKCAPDIHPQPEGA